MASASSSVRLAALPAPPRTGPWRDEAENTSSRFEPRREIMVSSSDWVPRPTETITITAAMPMITPSAVRMLRSQLPRSENTAERSTSESVMRRSPRATSRRDAWRRRA
jgi:hypothetical protein